MYIRSNGTGVIQIAKAFNRPKDEIKANLIMHAIPLLQKYKLSYRWKGNDLSIGGPTETAEGTITIGSDILSTNVILHKYTFLETPIRGRVNETLETIVTAPVKLTPVTPVLVLKDSDSTKSSNLNAGLALAGLAVAIWSATRRG